MTDDELIRIENSIQQYQKRIDVCQNTIPLKNVEAKQ